jgi:light-regulated signal transduction histidine kinase (bacteriophytochrome)
MAIEVAAELERSDPERSVECSIEKDLSVSCDPQLLRIVVENLLGNAYKYTAREDCARIELGAMLHQGRRTFFVRDNGVGFDGQYIHKLFQPFQRLHENEEFEGTGIGLATVARIIQRHHGRVWAEADVDQGATLYFSLPDDEA